MTAEGIEVASWFCLGLADAKSKTSQFSPSGHDRIHTFVQVSHSRGSLVTDGSALVMSMIINITSLLPAS
jgi:hypothetical protein